MLQLRCTKKVLDQFSLSKSIQEPKPGDSVLGNWYVNLIKTDRRKTLLFMSETTLLSFVIFGIRKDNAKDLPLLFVRGLVQILEMEEFSSQAIQRVIDEYSWIEVAKTQNRKALGNLNDLAFMYAHAIEYEGGLKRANLGEIMMNVNRTPQRNLNWNYSIEVARGLLEGFSGESKEVH